MTDALKKGTKLTVSGRLRTWTDKKDDNSYVNGYIINVSDIEFCGSKPESQVGTTPAPAANATAPAQEAAPAPTAPPMFNVQEDEDFGFKL